MKKTMKKVLAVVLALMMLSSTFVSFAAVELNQEAVAAHKGQYKNYLLLGDSAASGYRDEITDNDADFNEANNESTYFIVPGSYADVIGKAIVDGSVKSYAGPGYRTIEMRYMMEDDFAATCEDEYLFHPSHLYTYDDQYCAECQEYLTPGSEHFRKDFKKSIAEADLITLGIGGNDWGAYLTWVLADIIEKKAPSDKYVEVTADLAAIIANGALDLSTVEQVLEIAHYVGLLPEIIMTLPETLNYGLTNFYKNWDIMIEDIYALNPEVTLMVVGMSDNGVKGKYFDYNGVVGEPVPASVPEGDMGKAVNLIVDFIMTVGNLPMIEGAKKFGYTYVDTDGTTYVDSHPDADGHMFIANKIIEALPDKTFSQKFEDMKPGSKYYSAAEYLYLNGIMSGLTETTFGADEALTKGQLNAAINAIAGTNSSTAAASKVTMLEFAMAMLSGGAKKGFVPFFKGAGLMLRIMGEYSFKVGAEITRGEAANYLKDLASF